MRTQVAIIGAGPAGLMLSHLLHLRGIDSVVLEKRTQAHVENRVRAGVLEQGTVDLLVEAGLGERLLREGLRHYGFEIRFGERCHRIDFDELTPGNAITVYGQQEVVKDIITARTAAKGQILFAVDDIGLHNLRGDNPYVCFRHSGETHRLDCDFIAGCDGFHGVSRKSIPAAAIVSFDRTYPFAWLGVLVDAPPSADELVYSSSPFGFALHSMRSAKISRNYIQCPPGDRIEDWPDERIWDELHRRLETISDWALAEGKILEKSITPVRSFVCETMRCGRLLLAGDAAHIVPPTGAKGMNLALSDVRILARALQEWYENRAEKLLRAYPANCLRQVWRRVHFSRHMTSLLHSFPEQGEFERRLQLAELEYLRNSRAASRTLAENYVGFTSP